MIAAVVAASLHLVLVAGLLLCVVALVVAAAPVAATVRLVVSIAIAATVVTLARPALLASIWVVRRVVVSSLGSGILLMALAQSVVGALEGDLVRAVLAGLVGRAGTGPRVVCTVLLRTASAVVAPTTMVIVTTASVVLIVEGLALIVRAAIAVVPAIVVAVVAAAATSIPAIFPTIVVELAVSIAGLPVEVGPTSASVVVVVIAITVVSKLLIFGRAPVLVAIMLMAATHAATMAMASTTTTTLSVSTSDLLAVGRDYSWLVSAHLVVAHGSIVSPVEATSAASRWEGRSAASSAAATPATTTAAIATTTSLVAALVLGFSLLDIDSSPINLSNRVVLDQVLSNGLVGESDEAEAAGGPSVDIFEDDSIVHLPKLHEVLLELLRGQLEVEAAHEDLALWVRELH